MTDRILEDNDDSSQPWDHILSHAAPRDHVVQLYQDQDFLNRAVCRFAGAALANGEGVILVPTVAHWNAFRPRLEAEGSGRERRAGSRTADSRRCGRNTTALHGQGFAGHPYVPWACRRDNQANPRSRELPQGAVVGRDGQRPLGARGCRRQHESRRSVRSGGAGAGHRDILLFRNGQLRRRNSHPHAAEARGEPFPPYSGRRLCAP